MVLLWWYVSFCVPKWCIRLCSKVILLPLAACHGNAIASRRSRTCIYCTMKSLQTYLRLVEGLGLIQVRSRSICCLKIMQQAYGTANFYLLSWRWRNQTVMFGSSLGMFQVRKVRRLNCPESTKNGIRTALARWRERWCSKTTKQPSGPISRRLGQQSCHGIRGFPESDRVEGVL